MRGHLALGRRRGGQEGGRRRGCRELTRIILIAGLGNPGFEYEHTRHNAGFALAELAAARWKATPWEPFGSAALLCTATDSPEKTVLLKPMAFMNRSGKPVREALLHFGLEAEHLLVCHDDMDLESGSVRLKFGGGHGGHNGLRSIIEALGTADFARLRLGVGRPPEGTDPVDHVLGAYSPAEAEAAEHMLARALEAASAVVRCGVRAAMNEFNKKGRI